jgi:hypothetical protein
MRPKLVSDRTHVSDKTKENVIFDKTKEICVSDKTTLVRAMRLKHINTVIR